MTTIFLLGYIGNADLTLVYLYQCIVSQRKVSARLLSTSRNEKINVKVMLSCLADGCKLPPYIVFKDKTAPKENFPKGAIVRCDEKDWMDEGLVLDWIKSLWCQCLTSLLGLLACHQSLPLTRFVATLLTQ